MLRAQSIYSSKFEMNQTKRAEISLNAHRVAAVLGLLLLPLFLLLP